ncbi:MAG: hypothetical protein B6D78_01875 [gamma proteobacterium symbiont of Ctena orbiculata]|nr:MAG: hypothetical protein B6D78_01875 [gamma proteobacterium symbiont of Ctena orbiculata]PVV27088.1 MAG: hypothetical protein B6D79_04195 [gamma proteobacterium symbiont of Ctena orbiculata]
MDAASAYEQHAHNFLRGRNRSSIGAGIIRQWAHTLPRGAEVIEIACGGGYPVTTELVDAGVKLWAIDSSPTLVSEFHARFAEIPIRCEKVQDSDFFERTFDGVIAVGLLFLLPEFEQAEVISRVANILVPGGRFLFMAPIEGGTWRDMNTGIKCVSLGRKRYEDILEESGLRILATRVDRGKNNYYETEKLS